MGGQVLADWDALIQLQVLSCWMSKTGSFFKKKMCWGGSKSINLPSKWVLCEHCSDSVFIYGENGVL